MQTLCNVKVSKIGQNLHAYIKGFSRASHINKRYRIADKIRKA